VNRKIFESAQESVYQTLEVQWFPQFLSSPLYKACNEETIEFKASDGGKERSDTLIYYDSLVAMKNKREQRKKKNNHKKSTKLKPKKKKKKQSDS